MGPETYAILQTHFKTEKNKIADGPFQISEKTYANEGS